MRIELTRDQERALLAWTGRQVAAEVEAGCEPSGYELRIQIGPFSTAASAHRGTAHLELGEVAVALDAG